ncbi:hypothetical protein [Paenibacillus eucommiae]|uniref:Uncharacterized protein n=1 Tax=Paenibacillus eucommiae TaxID=1355755 RepID=A0ABS4J7H5_9BACL|nr:hypothetical protein [Paenibacillus eucommiae]MBP1995795.1 hypothetical protein [Paenibacillus eucommiae]
MPWLSALTGSVVYCGTIIEMVIGVLLGAVLGAVEPGVAGELEAAGSFGFSLLQATILQSAITATMLPIADFLTTVENIVINVLTSFVM